jgi:hypothetical protein
MAPKQECGATGVFGDFWLDGGGETASSHWSISDSEVLVIMICPRMASHQNGRIGSSITSQNNIQIYPCGHHPRHLHTVDCMQAEQEG